MSAWGKAWGLAVGAAWGAVAAAPPVEAPIAQPSYGGFRSAPYYTTDTEAIKLRERMLADDDLVLEIIMAAVTTGVMT